MAKFAPGMRVLIRDEEWMIRKCDPNSFKTYTLQCVGVSPLVRDKTAYFLSDLEKITVIDPAKTASIGKFGVGFKAVFQYTTTPYIYDPGVSFRIERFIVPSLLETDFSGRRPEETLFVFPFDHPQRTSSEAYEEIADKLKNLSYPLLFLSHIDTIEYKDGKGVGYYGKEKQKKYVFGKTTAEYICLSNKNGNKSHDESLWLFSRCDESNRQYSVGFFVDKNGQLRPITEPAFCFFPTKEVTGLSFIIHAPFLLTDSREGIRAGIPYNDKMLKKLAVLSADALVYLRDIGTDEESLLINDNIINIIPIDEYSFSAPSDKRKVSFMPFFEAIQNKLSTARLLPSTDGYIETENAYWASASQIPQLFSNSQLGLIVDNKKAKWVFVSLSSDEIQKNNRPLYRYLSRLVRTTISEDNLLGGRSRLSYYNRYTREYQTLTIIKGINEAFIENQSFDWLHRFYKWLSETKGRTEAVTDKPIFLDQEGKATAAFDKSKHAILFLPVKDISGYRVVHPELLKNPDTEKFVEQIGIKQPSLKDQIYNIILPLYREKKTTDSDLHFMMFFKYFCKCTHEEVEDFVILISDFPFLKCYKKNDPQVTYQNASNLYFPSVEVVEFMQTKKDTYYVALDEYKKKVGTSQERQLLEFLAALGVRKEITIITQEIPQKVALYRALQ